MSKSLITCFRPLIRGFFFYVSLKDHNTKLNLEFPSPHSGILFLSANFFCGTPNLRHAVSVPSFGDSFFMLIFCAVRDTMNEVSVPSFGDSFFISLLPVLAINRRLVSVPSFGDSFFIISRKILETSPEVSVPSFGDSFFITLLHNSLQLLAYVVSVPSFGDSFFMIKKAVYCLNRQKGFPSPHSGILFL